MVRGQARFLAVSAGIIYLALLARAVLIGSAAWEENLREWLYSHTERAQFAMEDLLAFDQKAAPLLVGVLVVALFATRYRRASLFLLVGAGGAAALGVAAKAIAGLLSTGARDFPSGHATGSAGVAAALVLLLWDRPYRLVIAFTGVALVGVYGFVLVATDWHTPSEVLGGWFLALAWVMGVWLAAERARFPDARISPAASDEARRARWEARQERSLEPRA